MHGVYWLPALDAEGPLTGLDPGDWREGLRVRVKLLAVAMRALAEDVGAPGTFLVTGTRLGGRPRLRLGGRDVASWAARSPDSRRPSAESAPTLSSRRSTSRPAARPSALAELLIEETLRDPEPVEVGHADDLRWSVGLIERPAEPDPARALDADTVFCVTGAAGSIVSAITADLAAASGGTFHLLDLVPEPDPGDPDLARFASDREGLKRELAARIKEGGERPTPKLVERGPVAHRAGARGARRHRGDSRGGRHRALASGRHHRRRPGVGGDRGRPRRERTDRRPAALRRARDQPLPPRQAAGRVRPRLRRQGRTAGSTSSTRSATPLPGTAVVFSSIAGRFGNAGQTDYAAANDLMCKSVSAAARRAARCEAWRSTGRPGPASAWPAEARFRR